MEESDEEYYSLDEDEMEQLKLNELENECTVSSKCESLQKDFDIDKSANKSENLDKETKNYDISKNSSNKDNDKNSYDSGKHSDVENSETLINNDNEDGDLEKENEINEEEYRKSVEETLSDDEKLERKDKAQILKDDGNKLFRDEKYTEAIDQYTEALNICPYSFPKERSIMYSNRGACYMKLGKNEEAVKDCSSAIELHPHYMKAILRRAELYEKTEKLDEALNDYTKAVELDPNQTKARITAMRLTEEIKERNEKMKQEMLGKLKDLGNLVLKPFGLSTDNFQLQQNPDTGSYSVNFKQN